MVTKSNHHQAAGSGRKDQPGVYYATHRNGRWQRVNPEDLVDSYLRAWSLPPDLAHSPAYDRVRDLSGDHLHHHHRRRRRKHHSAMPDLQGRGQGQGGRRAPPWVHSLERLAREDRVEPSHARLTKRNKKRKKRRALQAQIRSWKRWADGGREGRGESGQSSVCVCVCVWESSRVESSRVEAAVLVLHAPKWFAQCLHVDVKQNTEPRVGAQTRWTSWAPRPQQSLRYTWA